MPTLASGAPRGPGQQLVDAARRQIGVTTGYDSRYRTICYPGGDVPRSTGVCADVVVAAHPSLEGGDFLRKRNDLLDEARAWQVSQLHADRRNGDERLALGGD